MLDKDTITRFVEAFVAVFVAAFAASAIFSNGTVDLFGPNALQSIVAAVGAAALLAIRRVLAVQS